MGKQGPWGEDEKQPHILFCVIRCGATSGSYPLLPPHRLPAVSHCSLPQVRHSCHKLPQCFLLLVYVLQGCP